jgi:hypothetical protein
MKRRRFLAALGVIGVAGCSGDGTETVDTTIPDETMAVDTTAVNTTPTMTTVETDTYQLLAMWVMLFSSRVPPGRPLSDAELQVKILPNHLTEF